MRARQPSPVVRLSLLSLLFFGLPAAAQAPAPSGDANSELSRWARALRVSRSATDYRRLSEFAMRAGATAEGARAALALGAHDAENKRHAAARAWFERAQADPLLREYALYWRATSELALNRPMDAFERLQSFRSEFPQSALRSDATATLARAALAARQSGAAAAALAGTLTSPDLLLLRAQALERLSKPALAARDYAAIYYGYPLSPSAKPAQERIAALRISLRSEFPEITAEQHFGRVQAFLDARRCPEARAELDRAAKSAPPLLPAPLLDLGRVRLAVCHRRGRPAPGALEKLKVGDAEAAAERLLHLATLYRDKREDRMMGAVEEAALRYPRSRATANALFLAANYFWTRLEHARAAALYRRVLAAEADAEEALTADWRMAWHAYLAGSADAAARIEEHLRRHPRSPYLANGLYWLGRLAERNGEVARARAIYSRTQQRFAQSYYGMLCRDRLNALGEGTAAEVAILSVLTAPPAVPDLNAPLPAAIEQRRKRAAALRSIAFDVEADRELRAAYDASRSPRLLLELAQAAHEAERHVQAVTLARQAAPQLDARRLPDAPEELWRTVYPLFFADHIASAAGASGVDPMLMAGLIRQESVFQARAVSRAGALGLMQVMPRTGRQLARQMRLPYSRARLFQPEYNARLGARHLADLLGEFRTVEEALAAYNAGESRVNQWTAGRTYSEPAEFVEAIPFTETRDYVQIVLRNAAIYRQLYSASAFRAAAQ
jgi:soluble lytic murein transglycosylase